MERRFNGCSPTWNRQMPWIYLEQSIRTQSLLPYCLVLFIFLNEAFHAFSCSSSSFSFILCCYHYKLFLFWCLLLAMHLNVNLFFVMIGQCNRNYLTLSGLPQLIYFGSLSSSFALITVTGRCSSVKIFNNRWWKLHYNT